MAHGSSIDEAVDAGGARWTLEPGLFRRAAAGSEPTETRIEPHAVALAIAPSLRRLFVRHASGAVHQARILDDGRLSRFSAFVTGPGEPAGLAVDGADEVWVCRRELDAVEHYDRAGRLIERVATPAGLQVCGFADDTSVLLLAGSTDDRSWLAGHRVARRPPPARRPVGPSRQRDGQSLSPGRKSQAAVPAQDSRQRIRCAAHG